MTVCQGCGADLPPRSPRGGRERKWCSERCRKVTLYSRRCLDCGTVINTDGSVANASERCTRCANVANGAVRKVWTREAIIAAVKAWAAEFGEPPAQPDWQPVFARRLGDPERAKRFEDRRGQFPTHMTVYREFGTWNTAIAAAGFTPRPVGRPKRDRVAA